MSSLRIRLEGAWERLEAAGPDLDRLEQLLDGDWSAQPQALLALIAKLEKLPATERLKGKHEELDDLIADVEQRVAELNDLLSATLGLVPGAFAEALAHLRDALDDEVLYEAASTGWKGMLKPGRFSLTRTRLWWKPKRGTPSSWPSPQVDLLQIPELGRVALADRHALMAIAEVHATPLFRGVKNLVEPDLTKVLKEASRPALRGGGDVVLTDEAIVFLPQTRAVWSLATGHEGAWLSPVEVTVLLRELSRLPKAERDLAIARAATHPEALRVPREAVPEQHFVDAGQAYFGVPQDGVMVRLSAQETVALERHLKAWGIARPETRVQYLRRMHGSANLGDYSQLRARRDLEEREVRERTELDELLRKARARAEEKQRNAAAVDQARRLKKQEADLSMLEARIARDEAARVRRRELDRERVLTEQRVDSEVASLDAQIAALQRRRADLLAKKKD